MSHPLTAPSTIAKMFRMTSKNIQLDALWRMCENLGPTLWTVPCPVCRRAASKACTSITGLLEGFVIHRERFDLVYDPTTPKNPYISARPKNVDADEVKKVGSRTLSSYVFLGRCETCGAHPGRPCRRTRAPKTVVRTHSGRKQTGVAIPVGAVDLPSVRRAFSKGESAASRAARATRSE